jgi:hypothetical protein
MILSNIGAVQNLPKHLEQLAAMRRMYQRAKRLLALQFFLTVPAALVSAAFAATFPDLKVWVVFYSLTVGILDTVFLDRLQKVWKKKAARVQEEFDCEVLGLDWNPVTSGQRADWEDIAVAAKAYTRRNDLRELRNWYPPIVDALPLPLARLICQRANCWWDSSLRKRVAQVLTALLVAEILIVITVALAGGDTNVQQLILSVYAPLAPAVLWTLRERYRQLDAATGLDSLRSHVEGLWQRGVGRDESSLDELTVPARDIQNLIFSQRAGNPLIFDWVHALVRPKQQQSMEEKAREMVEERRRHVTDQTWSVGRDVHAS